MSGDDRKFTAQSQASVPSENVWRDARNFSLVLGGPLYQLLRRARLSDDALMMLRRRIVVLSLFAWLPLLLFATFEGNALGEKVAVPFLMDIEVHLRFLVAMPLLILAELVVHLRMHPVVEAFIERKLIPDDALEQFDAAITAAFRLRNSVPAEIVLIALVYGVGVLVIWQHYMSLPTATWYATPTGDGKQLSLAGMWFAYVSLPIFQFLLIRWYFRLFIWARFLWQVSRLKLQLLATHPDRVGGLGFLANTAHAFAVLAFAHGVMVASQLATQIFFAGAALPDFKAQIALVVVFLLLMVFGPMLVFAPQLAQAKRKGLREYGTLAQRYVREFDTKWIQGGAPADEALVGSGDIQSLADLGNSYEVVRGMRITPANRDSVVQLAAAVLLPIVPLALTMMPLEELLKQLFGLLF